MIWITVNIEKERKALDAIGEGYLMKRRESSCCVWRAMVWGVSIYRLLTRKKYYLYIYIYRLGVNLFDWYTAEWLLLGKGAYSACRINNRQIGSF